MKSSVEAIRSTVTVGGRTAFHQDHAPSPVTTVDRNAPAPAMRMVLAKVKEVGRKGGAGCGAYVFVDPSLQVYVLSEESSMALQWVKSRFGWLVGYYCVTRPRDPRIPVLKPTLDGITGDVLEQIGQVTT